MAKYKLSIIVPCYERPQRTIRAISSVLNQQFDSYHAMFIFDGCPYYDEHEANGVFDVRYDKSVNKIEFIQTKHHGGWGYFQRNLGIEKAEGEYTIFMDNDDFILRTHFENYYNGIAGTPYDMVYFNSFLEPRNQVRNTELAYGMIGHAEIIVKTEFLKNIPPQTPDYGHDFQMIQYMMWQHAMVKKMNSIPTYIVKSLPEQREHNLD